MKIREKLFQIFDILGVKHELQTFDNRKQLQKLTYLIGMFGVSTGFQFSWYIHGPYNTTLTAVLYNDHGSNTETSEITSNDKKKLKDLKDFLGTDIKSSRNLELIGSLHFLINLSEKQKLGDDEIIDNFLKLKPQFNRDEVKFYLKRIREFLS